MDVTEIVEEDAAAVNVVNESVFEPVDVASSMAVATGIEETVVEDRSGMSEVIKRGTGKVIVRRPEAPDGIETTVFAPLATSGFENEVIVATGVEKTEIDVKTEAIELPSTPLSSPVRS